MGRQVDICTRSLSVAADDGPVLLRPVSESAIPCWSRSERSRFSTEAISPKMVPIQSGRPLDRGFLPVCPGIGQVVSAEFRDSSPHHHTVDDVVSTVFAPLSPGRILTWDGTGSTFQGVAPGPVERGYATTPGPVSATNRPGDVSVPWADNPEPPRPETDADAMGLAVQELVSGTGIPARRIGLWMVLARMRKLWFQSGSCLLTTYGAPDPSCGKRRTGRAPR